MRIVVYHAGYGCETGCCGHVVEIDPQHEDEFDRLAGCEAGYSEKGVKTSAFEFDHPYGQDPREFAEAMVRDHFGAEHVADLDWENCVIVDD